MIPAQSAEIELKGAESEWILTYTADEPTRSVSTHERAKQ